MRFYYWVNQSLYKTVGTIKYIVAFLFCTSLMYCVFSAAMRQMFEVCRGNAE